MTNLARVSFWRAYAKLNRRQRAAADAAFRQFVADAGHPSLHFKKLAGFDNVWSVRVTLDLRAVGEREGDAIEWVWIGPHDEFDKLFG